MNPMNTSAVRGNCKERNFRGADNSVFSSCHILSSHYLTASVRTRSFNCPALWLTVARRMTSLHISRINHQLHHILMPSLLVTPRPPACPAPALKIAQAALCFLEICDSVCQTCGASASKSLLYDVLSKGLQSLTSLPQIEAEFGTFIFASGT